MHDLELVRSVIAELQQSSYAALLIGGWAEELHGMTQPRPHNDIDVVVLDPPLDVLDAFVAKRHEVVEKHLSQKRAYLADDVLVELFIATRQGTRFETIWWGHLHWNWPPDMEPVVIAGLPVASQAVLRGFRQSYAEIIAARPW